MHISMIDDAPVVICGFPSPAEDYAEDSLDFNAYLGISRPSVYALRARGYSMIGAGILPDDILIVDKARPAEHRAIVVACIDGEFTLKRLLLNGGAVLHAENPDYPDIHFHGLQEVEIFGVVTGIVRRL